MSIPAAVDVVPSVVDCRFIGVHIAVAEPDRQDLAFYGARF
jgi:hypothetical protein